MNNLLEAIQKYPVIFIDTLKWRSETSPSKFNSEQHNLLAEKIKLEDWISVKKIISNLQYHKGLDGVVTCLNIYDYDENFTINDHNNIILFFKEDKLFS